jgi:hypothetical protein
MGDLPLLAISDHAIETICVTIAGVVGVVALFWFLVKVVESDS